MATPGDLSEPTPRRSAWQPAVELALVLVAGALVVALAADVLSTSGRVWRLPAGLAIGLVAADFASGTLHWFCDRFFSADTPVVGRLLIAPFRAHHDDPQGIVRHGLLELHGNSCIPVIAVLLGARSVSLPPLVESSLLFFVLAALATNQFHRWAHDPDAPRAVRWLQRRAWILPPHVHARHHSGDFDRCYCMTTGWLNSGLDRVEFFPRLERAIRAGKP